MLVSHESPLSMLEDSRIYNDYCYCLVHLLDQHPEYLNFFKQSLTMGREVLLDNSIFELGVSFDPSAYAKHIEALKPTYYVLPDVLEDAAGTQQSAFKFMHNYPDLDGLKIGVVQGKTYQELVDCYKWMDQRVDYIAISFDYSYYQTTGISTSMDPKLAKLEKQMTGRQKLVDQLYNDRIWNINKPHHLLGCSLAAEFKHYKNTPSVRSVDTSNPVVAGLLGDRYLKDIGLKKKDSIMLADLIDSDVTTQMRQDIFDNTEEFKAIIGR